MRKIRVGDTLEEGDERPDVLFVESWSDSSERKRLAVLASRAREAGSFVVGMIDAKDWNSPASVTLRTQCDSAIRVRHHDDAWFYFQAIHSLVSDPEDDLDLARLRLALGGGIVRGVAVQSEAGSWVTPSGGIESADQFVALGAACSLRLEVRDLGITGYAWTVRSPEELGQQRRQDLRGALLADIPNRTDLPEAGRFLVDPASDQVQVVLMARVEPVVPLDPGRLGAAS